MEPSSPAQPPPSHPHPWYESNASQPNGSLGGRPRSPERGSIAPPPNPSMQLSRPKRPDESSSRSGSFNLSHLLSGGTTRSPSGAAPRKEGNRPTGIYPVPKSQRQGNLSRVPTEGRIARPIARPSQNGGAFCYSYLSRPNAHGCPHRVGTVSPSGGNADWSA
ncbi:MAG: hypothetical protein HC881_18355 [Leptolyngbyaceae cyanobacterium SL_7_1]|nr:hypothetical protein [Leptolyngbyaceae cyanobacterium SL_7_1]